MSRLTIWGCLIVLMKIPSRVGGAIRRLDLRARLGACGHGVFLGSGFRIENPEYVQLGDNVYFNDQCWISTVPPEVGAQAPTLIVGANTYVGRFAVFACMQKIEIGQKVLISDRVFISDSLHGFRQLGVAVADQPIFSPGPVLIGDGSWIGIGASILPNVKIGKQCVIGANAVVTHDVPDFHLAVGVPARVTRRIDEKTLTNNIS
ncbi:acyltransferase [Polynucleobacter paneuropaeus]|jgi:acetyltransferase-like isoleucine patch superfamily enzyme|uniref:acyltransferase n=1 Tax=Polynucleobacter paneuropaeus TaxID=2527775 RepID=UPI001BFE8757|nr:acyltransferase [Polynucleobacter paneuropaeus]MBT8633210.1 acyltransferase [Polynucleobacter paneuropaeus]